MACSSSPARLRVCRLTDMGRKLFAIAERLFEAETRGVELLSRGRTLEEGQLTIGADAASHILPELARFRLKHPKLSVRLVTGNSAQLLKRLEDFSIDIAVTAERPPEPSFLARQAAGATGWWRWCSAPQGCRS